MTVLSGVLDGVNVVEFAQNAAIPHCGRLLAGLGADVVKARCEVRGPSPRLAEHTADVMAEIGLDPQTVEGLLVAGTLVDGTMKGNA